MDNKTEDQMRAEIQDNLAKLTKSEETTTTTNNNEEGGRELSDFEQRVSKMGWNPKGNKTAEEWLYFGFEDRGRKLNDLGKAVESLKELSTKQEQRALEQARAELNAKRDEAIARGDVQQVKAIEQFQQNQGEQQTIVSYANAFVERNKEWYKGTSYQDLKMQKAVHEMDKQLAALKYPPEKHFEALENYMRGEFKDYFGDDNTGTDTQQKASAVEGGGNTNVVKTSSKKSYSFDDLNEAQKIMAKRFERTGVMSTKDYITNLIKSGDLK